MQCDDLAYVQHAAALMPRRKFGGSTQPVVSAPAGVAVTIAAPAFESRRMAKGAVRLCTAEDTRIVVTTIAQSCSCRAKSALPSP